MKHFFLGGGKNSAEGRKFKKKGEKRKKRKKEEKGRKGKKNYIKRRRNILTIRVWGRKIKRYFFPFISEW